MKKRKKVVLVIIEYYLVGKMKALVEEATTSPGMNTMVKREAMLHWKKMMKYMTKIITITI